MEPISKSLAAVNPDKAHGRQNKEHSRPPLPHEPQRINFDQIVIVTKQSKLEHDLTKLNISTRELLKTYKQERADVKRIVSSHRRQRESLYSLQKIFAPDQFFNIDQLAGVAATRPQLVIALGGDNHLQYVSQFVKDEFFIGVNSDRQTSEGALTGCTARDLPDILLNLAKGEFRVQEWSRLSGDVDGTPLPLTLGDIFLGEKERLFMSRHVLRYRGIEEEQKGSGLLISSGSGSSGWFQSANRSRFELDSSFPRTMKSARFVLTEAFQGRLNAARFQRGDILPGEQIEVFSLNDSEGVVACDSYYKVPFVRGQKATILLSKSPLKVIEVS